MIMLPVPDEHYQAMVQALAQLMAGNNLPGPPSGSGSSGTSGATASGGNWPPSDLQRLKAEPLNSAARAMLDLTAERPGKQVLLNEIKSRTGLKFHAVRGQLAAFSKMLWKRYGHSYWPIRVERDHQGLICYIGTQEFANEWNRKP